MKNTEKCRPVNNFSWHDTEAEEAATWLIDVGLGNIVDNLMENNQLVTEASLANAVIEDNLTTNQYQTIRKRVETLRVTLKGRKTRAGAGQQRPDCRDIFRDPEVSFDGEIRIEKN
jgi:hypothetical protein